MPDAPEIRAFCDKWERPTMTNSPKFHIYAPNFRPLFPLHFYRRDDFFPWFISFLTRSLFNFATLHVSPAASRAITFWLDSQSLEIPGLVIRGVPEVHLFAFLSLESSRWPEIYGVGSEDQLRRQFLWRFDSLRWMRWETWFWVDSVMGEVLRDMCSRKSLLLSFLVHRE